MKKKKKRNSVKISQFGLLAAAQFEFGCDNMPYIIVTILTLNVSKVILENWKS